MAAATNLTHHHRHRMDFISIGGCNLLATVRCHSQLLRPADFFSGQSSLIIVIIDVLCSIIAAGSRRSAVTWSFWAFPDPAPKTAVSSL